jgi:hypothetical protein
MLYMLEILSENNFFYFQKNKIHVYKSYILGIQPDFSYLGC